MGFLSDIEDNPTLLGANDNHVVYEKSNIQIAVPYVSGAGFYFRDKNNIDFPKYQKQSGWIKLCNF